MKGLLTESVLIMLIANANVHWVFVPDRISRVLRCSQIDSSEGLLQCEDLQNKSDCINDEFRSAGAR